MHEEKTKIRTVLPLQVIFMLISVLASLADGIMINRFLGDAAQAAYGLTTPLILLNTTICGGVASGIQILTGRSMGKNRSGDLKEIYATGVVYGMGMVFCLVIPVAFFPRGTAVLLGAAGEEMIRLTADYLRYIVLSFPFVLMMFILPPFIIFYGKKITATWSAVILFFSDLLFNYINVKYVHGGMMGMAVASDLSYLLCVSFFLIRKNATTQNMLKLHIPSASSALAKTVLKYGNLYFLYKICTVALSFSLNRVLAKTDNTAFLTANAVLSTVTLVTEAFTSGSNTTTIMLSSYWLGRNEPERFKRFRRDMLLSSVIMHIVLAAFCLVFAGSIIGMFRVRAADTLRLAKHALRLFMLSIPFNAFNGILRNIDLCTGKTLSACLVTFFNHFIMPFAAILLLAAATDMRNVWAAYVIGQGLVTVAEVTRRTVFTKNACGSRH